MDANIWNVNEIEAKRTEVHDEILRVLLSGMSAKAKSARLSQLKRERRSLEDWLEVSWKERMEREAASRAKLAACPFGSTIVNGGAK